VTLRPLCEDRDPGEHVRAGLEIRQLLSVSTAPAISRAHSAHASVGDQELHRRGLGQDGRAARLGLGGKEAAELRERGDVVAVVPHRRRRGYPHGAPRCQKVDRLVADLAQERQLVDPSATTEEAVETARVDDGAREQMGSGLLALVEHRDRNLPQTARSLRILLEQLAEPDRAGEPSRPRAHDEHADLDRVGVGRDAQRLPHAPRRRIPGRDGAH
jgi:hypothetical protein